MDGWRERERADSRFVLEAPKVTWMGIWEPDYDREANQEESKTNTVASRR